MLQDFLYYLLQMLLFVLVIYGMNRFLFRKRIKAKSEINNLDFVYNLIQGKCKLEDLSFSIHLLSPSYPKNSNKKADWDFAREFEVKDNNYLEDKKEVKLNVESQNGDIFFVAPEVKWQDTNIQAGYAIVKLENQIICTMTFGECMETINGTFSIEWPKGRIIAIRGEL